MEKKNSYVRISSIKFFIITMSVLLVLILVVIAIIFNIEKNIEIKELIMDEQHLLHMAKGTMKDELEHVIADIHSVKLLIETGEYFSSFPAMDLSHLRDELKAKTQARDVYKQFLILDKFGQKVLDVDLTFDDYKAVFDNSELGNIIQKETVNQALSSKTDSIFFSDIEYVENIEGDTSNYEPIMFVGTAIIDQNKKVRGAIVFSYLASSLLEGTANIKLHNDRNIKLINSSGFHLKPEIKKLSEEKSLINTNLSLWETIQNGNTGYIVGKNESSFYAKVDIKTFFNYNEKNLDLHRINSNNLNIISSNPWYFYYSIPNNELYTHSNSLFRDISILGFIMLTIMSIVVGYTALAISKRQKAEEHVFQLNEILKIFNKILRHDLNGKFTAIRLSIDNYQAEKNKDYLDMISQSTLGGIELINQMRKLETLANTNKLFSVQLSKVFDEIIKEYKIPVKISGDGMVMADEVLRSVFDNIIRNAIMHGLTKKMGIIISEDKKTVKIEFVDYGKGIPVEIREKVFEEGFKHGDTGNTGLGLYIVKKTIERYKGKISIKSNKPKGTIFVIELQKSNS